MNISLIACRKCGYDENESLVHLHHIIPKCIGGTDKDGRIYLCKKCHDILSLIITKWLWNFVIDTEAAKFFIRNRTEVFIGR